MLWRAVGGKGERRLLALANKERLVSILEKMLDEDEFLSEHGIRSYVPSLRLACERLIHGDSGYLRSTRTSRGAWT